MKFALPVLAAALLFATGAQAQAPSAEQQAEFYKTCMSIAQNETLCACKRDAAPKLIDAKFMDVVIAAMRGKAPPAEYDVPYNDYIRQSNAVCIPGY